MNFLKIRSETNLAGLLLILGATTILITIGFEHKIGWIGTEERPAAAVPYFIKDHWMGLQQIWSWQALGFLLKAVGYILLLKNETKPYKSLLFTLLVLLTCSITIAFGITIGSYGPALAVFDQQPAVFTALRGAVRVLYLPGLMSLLFLAILYLYETFSSTGILSKKWGLLGLVAILIGILLSMVPGLPGKTLGAVIFLFPFFMGIGYYKTNQD